MRSRQSVMDLKFIINYELGTFREPSLESTRKIFRVRKEANGEELQWLLYILVFFLSWLFRGMLCHTSCNFLISTRQQCHSCFSYLVAIGHRIWNSIAIETELDSHRGNFAPQSKNSTSVAGLRSEPHIGHRSDSINFVQ